MANDVLVPDATGSALTISDRGFVDLDNEFFRDLGTNGRRCVSCHVPSSGWTITPGGLQEIFDKTDGGVDADALGLGAVFRLVDGAVSPRADVATLAQRRVAYGMLLRRGVIRIGLPIPPGAEFELVAVDDPYHFASATELSLFRRPLPTTNLGFDSAVMWDGREVVHGASVASELLTQASDAVVAHAQGRPLPDGVRQSIVSFELGLATAQVVDLRAGDLNDGGGRGGPAQVLRQPFYVGINDVLGDARTGAPFSPVVFDLYDAWAGAPVGAGGGSGSGSGGGGSGSGSGAGIGSGSGSGLGSGSGTGSGSTSVPTVDVRPRLTSHAGVRALSGIGGDDARGEARRAVARGQALFNGRAISISGVSGINDEPVFGSPSVLVGTCGTCHDAPNGGDHSVVAPLNIGIVDAARRTPDMPLYTLRNKVTGATVQVTDPGRALVDGKWAHVGRFKGPMLRDLAVRAPYFHDGSAVDLAAVVDFYDGRFLIGFSMQEKSDLVAFLGAL